MAEQVEFVLEEVDRKTFFILSGTCCHGKNLLLRFRGTRISLCC